MIRSGWMTAGAAAAILSLLTNGNLVSAQQPAPAAKAVPAAAPQQSTEKLEVLADRPEAIYQQGEKITFKIRLLDSKGQPVEGKALTWSIRGDGNLHQDGKLTSGKTPVTVETKLDRPGFVLCRVYSKQADGKTVNGIGGAGADPLRIKGGAPVPADFNAFWDKAKAELAKVPMKATLTPVEIKDKNLLGKVECFDVKIDCAGGMPVSGYLAKPVGAKKGSLPIVISYHGAGVRSSNMPLGRAAKGCLALDINAHGLENGKPAEFYKSLADGSLKDYRTRAGNDPEKIYFRGMYLRVLRSLEYMKSLPEWDGKILIVTGTSQGGGQSLVAAGLDPQITCCVAYVPALCYQPGILYGQESGWPRFIKAKDGKPLDPAVVKTVAYYDAANFAAQIKNASCMLSTGFIDTVCAPTSVYVAFNNIPGNDKTIRPTPLTTHSVPRETYAAGEKFIDDHISKMQQQNKK